MAACNSLIDGRDRGIWEAGQAASIEVLAAVVGNKPPDATAADALEADLRPYRDDLATTVESLAGLEPPADLVDAWDTFLGSGRTTLAALDQRLAALADWEATAASVAPDAGDPDAFESALAAVELLDRDCAVVFRDLGPLPEHAGFVAAAAAACTEAAERRRAGAFAADTDLALDAVVTAVTGDAIEPSDELVAALRRLAAEWQQTHDAWAAIDPADAPVPAEWQGTLTYAEQRAGLLTARADAVESGDAAAIAGAFALNASPGPGIGDLAALGLATRDCRALRA